MTSRILYIEIIILRVFYEIYVEYSMKNHSVLGVHFLNGVSRIFTVVIELGSSIVYWCVSQRNHAAAIYRYVNVQSIVRIVVICLNISSSQ
jgi:hypothetical protein